MRAAICACAEMARSISASCVDCVAALRQVLGKVQEAAAVVNREGWDLAYRAMHNQIRLARERPGKAAGDAERGGAAILGEKDGFPGAR